MTRLTAQEIEVIRKRAEQASVGDWYSEISTFENATEKLTEIAVQPGVAMQVRTEADAEFIANAREDIPKLLVEVERLRERNKVLNNNRNEWMTSHFEFQQKSDKFRKALETIANSDGWLIEPTPLCTTEEAYDKCVDIATEAIK